MEKKASVTSAQLILLLIWSRLMLTYTFMPVLNAPPSNQDVWIDMILGVVCLAVLSWPLLYLRRRFPDVPAVALTQNVLGGFAGGVVVVIFALLALFCFTSCALMDVVFITSSIFQETPPWAILVFILVPVAYTAYHGIGTIGRISVFIVPYIILTVLMFFFMGVKDMDLDILKPVLADSTLQDLAKGSFLTASISSEMLIFFVFGFFLRKGASLNRVFLLDLLFFLILALMMVIPTLCVLGADLSRHAWNPYFIYTKQLKAYEFLYRLESVNVLAWYLGSLLRSAIFCYMTSYLLSNLFRMKKSNGFVIPSAILVFLLVMVPAVGNSETMRKIASFHVLPYIMLPVIVGIPLLMVIVLGLKRLFGGGNQTGGANQSGGGSG